MSAGVTVALDAMGGDHAPDVVVEGARAAVRELDVRILLVGRRDRVEPLLAASGSPTDIELVDAAGVIGMDEHPANAVRQKPDASIAVGARLVREGRAEAFVSAGNTGAVMAAGLFEMKRIRGVERPALGAVFPTRRGKTLIVDVGANADCRPEWLAQFGLMGKIYMERVFGVPDPSVALLSIGEEESKGNTLVQQAHPLLRALPLRFVGNIEGKDVPAGDVDVVVCDGFVGNVVLKFAEGMASTLTGMIRQEIEASWLTKLAAIGVIPAFRRARRRMDYAEYGGAPLLGLNGIAIVAHGRSNALAIENAVRVAAQAVREGVVQQISDGIAELRPTAAGPAAGSATPG
jgi:glycerol-3-phosphate acyltransferase PlsX